MVCSCLAVTMFPDFSEILAFLEYLSRCRSRARQFERIFSALTPVIWTFLSPVVVWLAPSYVTNPVDPSLSRLMGWPLVLACFHLHIPPFPAVSCPSSFPVPGVTKKGPPGWSHKR